MSCRAFSYFTNLAQGPETVSGIVGMGAGSKVVTDPDATHTDQHAPLHGQPSRGVPSRREQRVTEECPATDMRWHRHVPNRRRLRARRESRQAAPKPPNRRAWETPRSVPGSVCLLLGPTCLSFPRGDVQPPTGIRMARLDVALDRLHGLRRPPPRQQEEPLSPSSGCAFGRAQAIA